MKSIVVLGLALSGLVAQGQNFSIEAERARIGSARAQQEHTFQVAEQACYQRFAVSDCLRSARAERRAAMHALRREELILNDLQRQTKAAAALDRIEQRLTPTGASGPVVTPAAAPATR